MLRLSSLALLSSVALAAANEVINMYVQLVKDIYPGATSSNPLGLTSFQGKMYFAAAGEGTGTELWVSDGTTDGTSLLMDINPGDASSNPSQFKEFNDHLFFRANNGQHGEELWVTDGTSQGTMMFADLYQGSESSNPSRFVVLGSQMLFQATTALYGTELWTTDGSVIGTYKVKDIASGVDGSSLDIRQEYTIGESVLVFTADDGVNGKSLWRTDGTEGGTYLIMDVSLGGASGPAFAMGRRSDDGGAVYFSLGTELWTTDGSGDGTVRVVENVQVSGATRISPYMLNGKTLFFGADPEDDRDQLWVTDGTSDGTEVLFTGLSSSEDLDGASAVVGLGFGPVVNGRISFMTDNGGLVNLWATDGEIAELLTEETFDWVLDVQRQPNAEQAAFLLQKNGMEEIWISNNLPEYTNKIAEMGAVVGTVGKSESLDDEVVLFQGSSDLGVELWKLSFPEVATDTTEEPTTAPTAAPTEDQTDDSGQSDDTVTPPDFQNDGDSAPSGSLCLAASLATLATLLSLF